MKQSDPTGPEKGVGRGGDQHDQQRYQRQEIGRCAKIGHKGVLFSGAPQAHGMPILASHHWDPLWAAAQDAEMSISFHVGGGDLSDVRDDVANIGFKANFARASAMAFLRTPASSA